jgi:hypothetical protein
MMLLRLWLIGVVTLLVLAGGSTVGAAATDVRLTVDPGDTPLTITGMLGGTASTFSGDVRLTMIGGTTSTLQLLSSDLHQAADPSIIISRSDVSIPNGVSLQPGQPDDVLVTISNIPRPGDYSGTLQFFLSGQTPAPPLTIRLLLHIGEVPNVQPVAASQSIGVVRCPVFWLTCNGATLFLPQSVLHDTWDVLLDNRTQVPITVTEATAAMWGAKTGDVLTQDEIQLVKPVVLKANTEAPVAVTIARDRLSDDHYQGTLAFRIKGSDVPMIVSTDLSVCEGPTLALVVIFLGILVGRLAQRMQTPAAGTTTAAAAAAGAAAVAAHAAGKPADASSAAAEAAAQAAAEASRARNNLKVRTRVLARLSGLHVSTDDWLNGVARPLLFIVLLIILALLGLQTLYVNAGSTFGAQGVYDYLGLFLWGLSADIAQRTLGNLPTVT